MALIMSAAVADELREAYGDLPHDVIIDDPPPRWWPLDRPWPPRVTVTAPCWSCITGTQPAIPLDHLRLLAR